MLSSDDYRALLPFRDTITLGPLAQPDGVSDDDIRRLIFLGFLRFFTASTWFDNGVKTYVITREGHEELVKYERLEEERKQLAKDKADSEAKDKELTAIAEVRYRADSRRSWLQLIVNALIALALLVIGALLEHYFELIKLFSHNQP